MGYEGISASDVPEETHTLRSIFIDGRPPKEVHLHVRRIPIATVLEHLDFDIEFGDDSSGNMSSIKKKNDSISSTKTSSIKKKYGSVSSIKTASIKKKTSTLLPYPLSLLHYGLTFRSPTPVNAPFSKWIYQLYLEKDELLKRFYATGRFVTDGSETGVTRINVGQTWDGRAVKLIWLTYIFIAMAGFILYHLSDTTSGIYFVL
jgi:hypothetical protein